MRRTTTPVDIMPYLPMVFGLGEVEAMLARDRSEARVRRAERRACYLCVARERNSYFAHLKDRMVQVQVTLVASPRYHRWRSFLLREKFENRARLEVKAFLWLSTERI